MAEKSNKEIAALIYGCEVEELLGFRACENGDLSIIAPTGQKFVYPATQVEAKRAELKPKPKPRRKAPAKPRAKPAAARRRRTAAKKDERKH